MNGALLALLALDFRGRLVRRFRLLRQPRYLVASLAGGAYILFVVLPRLGNWHGAASGWDGARPGIAAGARGLGRDGTLAGADTLASLLPFGLALALAWGTTLVWVLSSARPALRLNEAELHLLLPAPLTRRAILSFALFKQQIGVLTGTLLVALLRGVGPPGQRLQRFLATWTLFTLFDLHVKGVSLWKARLGAITPARAHRQIAAVGAVWVLFWSALIWSCQRLVAGAAAAGPGWDMAKVEQIVRGAAAGLPGTLLTPFVWLSRPLAGYVLPRAGHPGPGWSALLALALVWAHYEWVLRSRGRFEEATLAAAQRRLKRGSRRGGRRLPAARSRRRQPFALSPAGRPEVAIYWKNLLLRSRTPLAHSASALAAICCALALANQALGAPEAMASTLVGSGLAVMLAVPLLAGLWLRNDLRSDLREVESLRTWPLAGWRLVGAELLAPATAALYLIGTGYGLLLAGALPAWLAASSAAVQPLLGRGGNGDGPSTGAALVVGGASLLPLALAVALLSIAVQNLATLTFPGWMNLGPERRRSAAFTGMRLLSFLGHAVAMALGLLPSALLLGAAFLLQRALGLDFRLAEAPAAALLAAAPLLVEVWLLVRLGGRRWQRLDPSREILEAPD